jgi:hypothetical protein
MAFTVTHLNGRMTQNPPPSTFGPLYEELIKADDEHIDVSVSHESGWTLGAGASGWLVWENVEDGEPQHMSSVSREKVLDLWKKLADGDIAAIHVEPWQPGYPR